MYAWNKSTNGEMFYKDAYMFQNPPLNKQPRAKNVWKSFVPPSSSMPSDHTMNK